jgi:hypothetical protein
MTATSNKKEADYHVAFNQPSEDLDKDKLLLFCREAPTRNRCVWDSIRAKKKYHKSQTPPPQLWWINKNYDELVEMNPVEKTRDLSWITSDKGKNLGTFRKYFRNFLFRAGFRRYDQKDIRLVNDSIMDGHILRMEMLDRIMDRYPSLLDLYGRGDFEYKNYRGEVSDKWNGLEKYRYSLAIENYPGEHYFTEKIVDALLSWCMPIYWGCTNLEMYLPEDSFMRIDIEDENAPEQVKDIVNSSRREENLDAIAEARERILNDYQIWPRVYDAVHTVNE